MSQPQYAEKPPDQVLGDDSPAEQVLTYALARFERLVLATSLGPQTLVVLELLHQMGRTLPVVLLDTGLLFRQTLELREKVEQRYGIEIRAVRPARSVAEQARVEGEALWERNPDRCCELRKVRPLRQALAGQDAWVTGLRRDQAPSRSTVRPIDWDEGHGLWRVSPLAGWDRAQVFAFLRAHQVPYNPLLDRGYRSVGCQPCTRPCTDPHDERAGRWAGLSKTECGIHSLFPPEKS